MNFEDGTASGGRGEGKIGGGFREWRAAGSTVSGGVFPNFGSEPAETDESGRLVYARAGKSGPEKRISTMAHEAHKKAAEHHENAAKAHHTAADHHEKGDHKTGAEHSKTAHDHSTEAHKHSTTAHEKSTAAK